MAISSKTAKHSRTSIFFSFITHYGIIISQCGKIVKRYCGGLCIGWRRVAQIQRWYGLGARAFGMRLGCVAGRVEIRIRWIHG